VDAKTWMAAEPLTAATVLATEDAEETMDEQAASNLMIDHWRRARRERSDGTEPAEGMAPDPDLALRLDMARSFTALRPEQRQLVWLAYVEGASHKEISEERINNGATKQRRFSVVDPFSPSPP
jgi:DNA-directed RNA polymerase specialized sigma24 family protein